MKQFKIIGFLFILTSLCLSVSQAAIEVYQFNDTEKTERFKKLTYELRCPKCQNQNIADSNAEIARDLRAKLQQMLVADKTDDDIVEYMLERYGDFVLYKPRIGGQTYLLWFGPLILLVIALIIVFFIVKKRSSPSSNTNNDELNKNQQQELDRLLKK